MGTLDDAIREHLELKKRSGASEEEVRRLESEAFGPVRREPEAPAEAEMPVSPEPEPEPKGEAPSDLAPPPVPPVAPLDPFLPAPPPVPPPAAPEPPEPARSWLEDDEPGPPQQSTSEFTAAQAADAQGGPPSDYVAPDEEAEDLLEETPDFLQETPEHDRLWFEQRPPRDFDFDE